jgi:hypothetical protein
MIRFLLLLLFMPSALADESPLFDRPSETGNLFALEREEDPSDFGASEDDGPPEPLVEPLEFAGQEAAIEEGRAALSEDAYPWYDKATDSFVMAKQPPPDREEWKATFAMLLNAIITAFVIGALVVMGWFFYRKRPQREDDDDADSADEEGEPPDAAMALPPELAAHADDFLAAAERAAAAGDYRLAICCLFHHLLDLLGKAGLIRLSRGRTNRQYLRQLAQHPTRAILTEAMRLFEGIYFGGHPADSAMWEKMRSAHSRISKVIARPKRMPAGALAIVAGLLFLGGCGSELSTDYGRSTGNSINGTRVLYRMLENRGHKVFRWEPEGSKSRADTYVVFAPGNWNYRLSSQIYEWLWDDAQVLFVAADFNALYYFWEDVARAARAQGLTEMIQAAENAKFDVLGRRLSGPEPHAPVDFDRRVLPAIGGWPEDGPLAPIPLRRARLYLNYFPGAGEAETLLSVDETPFVIRSYDNDYGDLFVLANGGFLLNYALINHDRRVLASRLVDQLGKPRRVAFVEASAMGKGGGGTRTSETFHLLKDPAMRRVFGHLFLFAIMWLLMQSPILGKPRRNISNAVHHFTAHLRAYASLLYRSGDRAHAQDLISAYEKPGDSHE